MDTSLYQSLITGQIDKTALVAEIQHALDTCAQAGFICTTPDNINTLCLIVGGIGFIIGVIACVGFQYTYRKASERRNQNESQEKPNQ